jgi:hypothetical protein
VLCGMNMLLTGIVGLYVARIHSEVKRRPLYVVAEALGFNSPEDTAEQTISNRSFPEREQRTSNKSRRSA